MELDVSKVVEFHKKKFELLEGESVTVGVFTDKKGAIPDYELHRRLPKDSTGKLVVKPDLGKADISLNDLAEVLDGHKGIFSDIKSSSQNDDLLDVANAFAVMDKTPRQIKQLENTCRAYVRNPIYRGEYGPNSKESIELKHFDNWGIQTGTLFNNIVAVFHPR